MQLKLITDYAIRVVLLLAIKGKVVSSKEISESMSVPQASVMKIMRQLSQAGMTQTHIGIQGGFSLQKDSKDIKLLDIIETMESTIKINHCLEKDGFCSRRATDDCPVHHFYCVLQEELETRFKDTSIYDLMNQNNESERRRN